MHLLHLPPLERILRIALAFSFLYPPLAALFDPYAWIGYFPAFVMGFVGRGDIVLLHIFGIAEVGLALWILFGKRVFVPCLIAALLLFLIVLFNLAQLSILFRDISLGLLALGLAWTHRPHGAS